MLPRENFENSYYLECYLLHLQEPFKTFIRSRKYYTYVVDTVQEPITHQYFLQYNILDPPLHVSQRISHSLKNGPGKKCVGGRPPCRRHWSQYEVYIYIYIVNICIVYRLYECKCQILPLIYPYTSPALHYIRNWDQNMEYSIAYSITYSIAYSIAYSIKFNRIFCGIPRNIL